MWTAIRQRKLVPAGLVWTGIIPVIRKENKSVLSVFDGCWETFQLLCVYFTWMILFVWTHLCSDDTFIFLVRHDVDGLVFGVRGTLVPAVTGTLVFNIAGRIVLDVTGRLIFDVTGRLVLEITCCVTVQITGRLILCFAAAW